MFKRPNSLTIKMFIFLALKNIFKAVCFHLKPEENLGIRFRVRNIRFV